MPGDADAEREALLYYLRYQRDSALAIVEGLVEEDWHRPVLPSQWTVAGMVEHLGDMERHWFQGVIAGVHVELPWDEGRPPYDPDASFACERLSLDVLGYYRDQCARGDGILAQHSLDDPPKGKHGDAEMEEPPSVRWIVLHVIEETAAHTGQLEVARELLDGRTNLGLR